MAVIVGVDVGGSGLRLQSLRVGLPAPGQSPPRLPGTSPYAGEPRPVRTAPGVRLGAGGIDVAALTTDARALLAADEGAPDVVVWSMRGLLFLADRSEVLRHVRAGLGARRSVVVSDAVASLVGALGGLLPGAGVASGTGAVAFGTDFADRWNRVDGWGHVLGDVGSGAWIGLAGLRAALRRYDGLAGGPHSRDDTRRVEPGAASDGSVDLLAVAVARFGAPETWPRQVMASPDAPERLAAFAPEVTSRAAADPVAARICADAGRGLAGALLAAARGLVAPTLVATGGVLRAEPVADALDQRLAEAGQCRSASRGTALDGALILGRRLLEAGTLPEHPAYLLVG